jgi:hypothetical protein
MARSRLHRRYVKKTFKANPPLFTDLVEFVVPGFGGFAATRIVTRVAMTQVAQRAPSWGKHAGAVASVGSFLAAWFLAHKWKFLEKWHTPIVVGSAIAAAQSLLQIYAPNLLGWVVSDATPELAAGAAQSAISAPDQQLAQLHLQATNEDPNEFTYNDSYDAGRYSGSQGQGSMKIGPLPPQSAPQQSPPATGDVSDLAIDDAIGTANLGVFANAN